MGLGHRHLSRRWLMNALFSLGACQAALQEEWAGWIQSFLNWLRLPAIIQTMRRGRIGLGFAWSCMFGILC